MPEVLRAALMQDSKRLHKISCNATSGVHLREDRPVPSIGASGACAVKEGE